MEMMIAGRLSHIPGAALRERFTSVATKQDVIDLAQKFVADIRDGTYVSEPDS